MSWDVFISHASEDKKDFVAPLAKLLSTLKINVWYDEFTLKVGDSLLNSIDKGLANSNFGIVILSKDFFAKNWTDYEYRGLFSREIGNGNKIILPIWHNITAEEILRIKPTLADKFALDSSIFSLEEIALKLIEVIKPEVYDNVIRILIEEKIRNESPKAVVKSFSSFDFNIEPRHNNLPKEQLTRIMIIQKTFEEVISISLTDTINNFKRETNPEREIMIWEAMTATYIEFNMNKKLRTDQKNELFLALIALTNNNLTEEQMGNFELLNKDELSELTYIYNKYKPNFSTEVTARIKEREEDKDKE